MRTALLVLVMLVAAAAQPNPTCAAFREEITAMRPTTPPPQRELLAQRQPGGLPGVNDSDEDVRSGPKQIPGGLPGRSKPTEMPATRSLQSPKAPNRPDPGAEPGAGQKGAPARKPAPDGSK